MATRKGRATDRKSPTLLSLKSQILNITRRPRPPFVFQALGLTQPWKELLLFGDDTDDFNEKEENDKVQSWWKTVQKLLNRMTVGEDTVTESDMDGKQW